MSDREQHPTSLSIAVLTSKRSTYSVKRLLTEGRERGHRMRAMDPTGFAILLEHDKPSLLYRGKPVTGLDAVIPRISASTPPFGMAVVQQMEQMGVFCANSFQGIQSSRDKFRASQIMVRRGIGLPRTAFVAEPGAVDGALDHVGGAPVVVKLIEGSQGVGVTLAEHRETAHALVDMLHSGGQQVLLQSMVQESRGRDVRVIVVGGKAIAAMRRQAEGDEFRSNLHRGGKAQAVELDESYARAAVRAAQVLGLRIAGVDILEGNDGPKVIEVNSSPGLEGIEGASKVDVAGQILDFVEKQCHLPDVDVRQRLSMVTGHSISELVVRKKGPFAGKSIGETPLAGENIRVLTAARDDEVFPLPPPEFRLQADDKVVVFGPFDKLRELLPPRGKRRRKLTLDGSEKPA